MNKNIIISGVSGFIAYHLVNYMLKKNYIIYGLDNNSSKNLKELKKNKNFKFIKINLSNNVSVKNFISNFKNIKFDSYWHLAANSDISKGINDYEIELNDTFLSTLNSINLCKNLNIKKFIFSSSSAIFGNFKNKIHEFSSPAQPISNYGAMKLASESFIYASSRNFNKVLILRFPNVVGNKMTHGLIFDLNKKIKINKNKLNILGNGQQKKPYLHVANLINYMYLLYKKNLKKNTNVFNIGPSDNGVTVKYIVNHFVDKLNLNETKVIYQNKIEGWKGDVIKYSYNNKLIEKTLNIRIPSSKESIMRTITDIKKNL